MVWQVRPKRHTEGLDQLERALLAGGSSHHLSCQVGLHFWQGFSEKKKVKPPLPHPPIPSSLFEEWLWVETPFSSPDNLLNFITVITGDEFSQSCLGWPWLGQWPAHLSSFSLWIILGKKDNGQEMQKSLFSPQDNPALIPQAGQLWVILNQGHCCSRLKEFA